MNHFVFTVSPANAINFATGGDLRILHYTVDINMIMKLEIPWWNWCLWTNKEERRENYFSTLEDTESTKSVSQEGIPYQYVTSTHFLACNPEKHKYLLFKSLRSSFWYCSLNCLRQSCWLLYTTGLFVCSMLAKKTYYLSTIRHFPLWCKKT